MELKKGENMIEHEAEIFSRPARTWFQSAKEKEKAKGKYSSTRSRRELILNTPAFLSEISKLAHESGGKSLKSASQKKGGVEEKVLSSLLTLSRSNRSTTRRTAL